MYNALTVIRQKKWFIIKNKFFSIQIFKIGSIKHIISQMPAAIIRMSVNAAVIHTNTSMSLVT